MLCRLINTISVESLEDVNKLLPLLTARSRVVQRAAYTVLHRYIPTTQEQVSFDVALSKSAVKLPDELMSLLLEAPTMESISATYGEDRTWTSIRAYLLSWKVVFDHFTNAVCLITVFIASLLTIHSRSLSKSTMYRILRRTTDCTHC